MTTRNRDRNGVGPRSGAARWQALALAALAGGAVLLPSLGASQGTPPAPPSRGVVTLNVNGPMSPRLRAILGDLIEPDSLSRLIATISKDGAPVRDLCAWSWGCTPVEEVMAGIPLGGQANAHVSGLVAPTMEIVDVAFPKPDRYAVIGHDNPILKAAGIREPDLDIAVPGDSLRQNNLSTTNAGNLLIVPGAANAAVSALDKDIQLAGVSQRQFRINRLLPDALIASRLSELRGISGVSLDEGPPRQAFSLITFQTSGEDCSDGAANWPFDVPKVVGVMRFNEKIRTRLKMGPPRRSRILIVDTGLGRTLAQHAAFSPLLYADPAELISPGSAQRQQNGEPICVDANNNGYWLDVFGTGAGSPEISGEVRCLNASFDHLDLVRPHPRKSTSQQIYNPDHGSFVGALAGGGPKFIASFPEISNYLGLSFFRVTKRSDHEALHVANDFPDITSSLDYAGKIDADVVNMSLKTGRDAAFNTFKDTNKTALLVTSAGNDMENLDNLSPDNRPASLQNLAGRMIVVAALQPDPNTPFWPRSARSPTRVHIAAPGALITSLGADHQEMCQSGTSAAAPLVSFVAAMIRALTGAPREIVRARLLAAADHVPGIATMIEDGRRLNPEAAFDVFVDRVELDGEVKRGWIEPASAGPMVQVCRGEGGALDASRGKIDLALLWEWWRLPNGKIKIRHRIDDSNMFADGMCDPPPAATFSFFDLSTGQTANVDWSRVTKLLPTPFRGVKATILKSDAAGEVRQ